jgi:hypothetical protein
MTDSVARMVEFEAFGVPVIAFVGRSFRPLMVSL